MQNLHVEGIWKWKETYGHFWTCIKQDEYCIGVAAPAARAESIHPLGCSAMDNIDRWTSDILHVMSGSLEQDDHWLFSKASHCLLRIEMLRRGGKPEYIDQNMRKNKAYTLKTLVQAPTMATTFKNCLDNLMWVIAPQPYNHTYCFFAARRCLFLSFFWRVIPMHKERREWKHMVQNNQAVAVRGTILQRKICLELWV